MIGNRELFDPTQQQHATISLITASVYFEIRDQSGSNYVERHPGIVVKEECHQVS